MPEIKKTVFDLKTQTHFKTHIDLRLLVPALIGLLKEPLLEKLSHLKLPQSNYKFSVGCVTAR